MHVPGPDSQTRRQSLRQIGCAAASAVVGVSPEIATAADRSRQEFSFCFVTDTHYLARKEQPEVLDDRSADVCRRLVETLNALEGEVIPQEAGGGAVRGIQGVIHGGDIVDSADKRGAVYERMIATEFAAFEADFGLTGRDGLLKYPVYEVHGNHDGPQGDTLVVDGIRRRNRDRPGLTNISENGLHYTWDWGRARFINLGIVAGESGDGRQRRRYAPLGSLPFLRQVLQQQQSVNQPLVITQHIDVARYSVPWTADEEKFLQHEWHPQDVQEFHQALRPHRLAVDFFGHTHSRSVYGWNGSTERQSLEGNSIKAFNSDNAAHFAGDKQAFFYVKILPEGLKVREVFTEDAWRSHHWTPEVWNVTG